MTRLRERAVPPYDIDVVTSLIIGPQGSDYTEEELELAWYAYKARFDRRRTDYWAHRRFESTERPS
ncbi:MAG TPA: hypothetical protein VKA47_07680 [Solirubrobacterales bacterium]|nr:hypothetical protein [Solirubrobacterales bacterium]